MYSEAALVSVHQAALVYTTAALVCDSEAASVSALQAACLRPLLAELVHVEAVSKAG